MRTVVSIRVVACLAAGLVLTWCAESSAQRGRSRANQAMRNIQRDIAAIEKQLKPAQEEWNKAAKELTQAQSDYKQAQSELEKAKKSLTERIGPKVGLPDALSRVEQAQAEYEKASAALVGSLRTDEGFQSLKERMTVAEKKLTALQDDKSALSGDKKQAAKESLEARETYRSRIDRDPAVKPRRDTLTKAEERLKEVRQKLIQESKSDAELHTAELSFKQAKSALERAQVRTAAIEDVIAALHERLASNYALLGN